MESLPIIEDEITPDRSDDEWFGQRGNNLWFPIWYPAFVLAIAGVGVLRVSRQFSIRWTLICVGVVALLLGSWWRCNSFASAELGLTCRWRRRKRLSQLAACERRISLA